MGWVSATGVFQHLHLRLVEYASRHVAPPLLATTLQREAHAASSDSGRMLSWMQVYLDNWDQGRIIDAKAAPEFQGSA